MPTVTVNDKPIQLDSPSVLLTDLLELMKVEDRRGLAIAVDGEVIPRSEWDSQEVHADASVLILTATQGG